ncbi:MAG TPA: ester cyclase [Ktedonobacteraceae bacterium]|nr:ester cyclase [Ktedonobacteraceae bacterium]
MSRDENATVIQLLFDTFNRRDLAGSSLLVTQDFELVDVPAGYTFHGPDGLLQWLQGFLTAGPDAKAEVFNTIVEGDWVATEHVGRFTHTGPLITPAGEIAPTGRNVELQFGEFYHIKDGKIGLLRA